MMVNPLVQPGFQLQLSWYELWGTKWLLDSAVPYSASLKSSTDLTSLRPIALNHYIWVRPLSLSSQIFGEDSSVMPDVGERQ
jgi:hypothetical protein